MKRKDNSRPKKKDTRLGKFKLGDRVTCLHEVVCYDQKTIFHPGEVAVIASITPKVRISGEPPRYDRSPMMLVVDTLDGTRRTSLNLINTVKVKSKQEAR